MSCLRCGKRFDNDFNNKFDKVSYGFAYNKCRGKTCPDCGKVRKLAGFESIHAESSHLTCFKCKRKTNYWVDKLCGKCFLGRERKRGCTCFFDKDRNESEGHHNNIYYYCPLCEETHPRESLCKECFEKEQAKYQTRYYNKKQLFFQIVLPTTVISLVIGFFLGWLFLVKLRKKKCGVYRSPN